MGPTTLGAHRCPAPTSDLFGGPLGEGGCRAEDQDGDRHFVAGSQDGGVDGPGVFLARLSTQLDFDDDPVDGLSIFQKDDKVSVELGGHELTEVGLGRFDLGIVGQLKSKGENE